MPEIILPNKWEPRHYQRPIWEALESGKKRAIEVAHRRWGKDDVCLHWAAVSAFERPATYWHMLPMYAQGRKAIWTAVNPHTGKRRIDEAFPHELRANTNEQEMFIRFRNGATWQVLGSDNFDSVVGSPPAGVTFSEWALSNPAAWGYLAPILLENGGWALFITSSRGRNHAKSMLDMARNDPETWFAEVSTVTDTGAISAEAVEAQRREYHGIYGEEAGDALIEQEYFCSFDAAVLGAYYGKELSAAERKGRITKIDVIPDQPVYIAWDIGVDDPMAFWCFQVFPGRINVVDYYESTGYGFDHYVEWLNERGYSGTDWVPHDAKKREPTEKGARTRIDSLIALGRRPRLVPDQKLMDGINAARITIPICYFDAERCAKGLDALREYKAEWDQQNRVFRKVPKHDWASHAADAFRYMSLVWKLPVDADDGRAKFDPNKPALAQMTVDQFWESRSNDSSGERRI